MCERGKKGSVCGESLRCPSKKNRGKGGFGDIQTERIKRIRAHRKRDYTRRQEAQLDEGLLEVDWEVQD